MHSRGEFERTTRQDCSGIVVEPVSLIRAVEFVCIICKIPGRAQRNCSQARALADNGRFGHYDTTCEVWRIVMTVVGDESRASALVMLVHVAGANTYAR